MISIKQIMEIVASAHGVKETDLLAKSRRRRISHPRQEAMRLAREFTDMSYPELGEFFGLDHTSVLHGSRAVRAREAVDGQVRDRMADMRLACAVTDGPMFFRHAQQISFKSVRVS